MSHGDVVNLIKESGLHVRLTIGNPNVPNVVTHQPAPGSNMSSGSGGGVGGNGGIKQNDPYFERYNMGSQPQL